MITLVEERSGLCGVERAQALAAQQRLRRLPVVVRRRRARDPLTEQVDEALWLVPVREVPGTGEDLGPRTRQDRLGDLDVGDGDDGVAAAPDDERRHHLGEVGAVDHRHDLAAVVDRRAQDVQEGRARRGVGEPVVDGRDLVQVVQRGDGKSLQHSQSCPGRRTHRACLHRG